MAEDRNDRELDAMLDSLLSTYSAAEPRPGLELRIRGSLKVHAAQRQRFWIWITAGAAAMVVVVMMMMAQLRPSQPSAPANVIAMTTPSPSHVLVAHAERPSSWSSKATGLAAGRPRHAHAGGTDWILLRAADGVSPDPGNVVFEQEKLYVAPVQQPSPETAAETPTSAPSIDIQDLGVESLEIKELPSAKSTDSKGDL